MNNNDLHCHVIGNDGFCDTCLRNREPERVLLLGDNGDISSLRVDCNTKVNYERQLD